VSEFWTVEKTTEAEKQFNDLSRTLKQSANDILDELAENGPTIFGAIEMRNNTNSWRVSFAQGFRMVYRVFEISEKYWLPGSDREARYTKVSEVSLRLLAARPAFVARRLN
jgi:mRNA-degrading endonuclease RelE of RelBE toxin-antitoxin system